MKRLIIIVFLAIGMTTYAQEKNENRKKAGMEKPSPEEHQERQLKRMTSELSLNTVQKEQIKQLLAEQGTKREKLKNTTKGTKEDMKMRREASKKKMQDDRKILEDKMKVILTPEQFSKWKTNQEKMREKNESRMKERMGDRMKNEMEN